MTGIVRTSVLMKYEQEFGVEDTGGTWFRLPGGLTASFDPSNNMTYNYGIGDRFWETAVAGKFSGSCTLNFKMDYNCINFLGACFDTYEYQNGTHVFSYSNGTRGRSFSLRYRKLNRMVGGPEDTTVVVLGCVCTSFSMKQGAGSANLDCTMQCSYVNEIADYSDLSETDWDYDSTPLVPVEWSCLNIGGVPVAGTESSGFTVTNGSGMVAGCGSRFDSNYYSGKVDITISTTVYSNNPERYLALMYSGGYSDSLTAPMPKGLQPIPQLSLRSGMTSVGGQQYSCVLEATNVMVNKSGMSQFGDSKITDSPTLKAQNCTLSITNGNGAITVWDS